MNLEWLSCSGLADGHRVEGSDSCGRVPCGVLSALGLTTCQALGSSVAQPREGKLGVRRSSLGWMERLLQGGLPLSPPN